MVTLRNLVVTMTLGGLWHGAGVLFVLLGLYHGLLLVLYRVLPIDVVLEKRLGRAGRVIAIVVFFNLVCIGWIFFRATPETFWLVWASIAEAPGVALHAFDLLLQAASGLARSDAALLAATKAEIRAFITEHIRLLAYGYGLVPFGATLFVFDVIGYRNECEFPDLYDRMNLAKKVATIVLFIYLIAFFGRRVANEFIYFQF